MHFIRNCQIKLRLVHINSWDLSLTRIFQLGEHVRLQGRLDAFNALNHTQFDGINTTLNFASLTNPNPTNLAYDASGNLVNRNGFGTVSSNRPPRALQWSVRLEF